MYEEGTTAHGICDNILEAIGDTPLVRLHRSTEHLAPAIYAKVESFNPGGSVKDRVAVNMILAGERKEIREPRGVTDGLVRLSVGLEHIDDLVSDAVQALEH